MSSSTLVPERSSARRPWTTRSPSRRVGTIPAMSASAATSRIASSYSWLFVADAVRRSTSVVRRQYQISAISLSRAASNSVTMAGSPSQSSVASHGLGTTSISGRGSDTLPTVGMSSAPIAQPSTTMVSPCHEASLIASDATEPSGLSSSAASSAVSSPARPCSRSHSRSSNASADASLSATAVASSSTNRRRTDARTRMRVRISTGERSSTSISSRSPSVSFRSSLLDCGSDIEQEVDHIAILDDVLLAFPAQPAELPRFGQTAGGDQVVIGDDLGSNETPLDVRVDLAGCLDRGGAAANGPGATLVGSDGEKWHQSQELERVANDLIKPRLRDAEVTHECGGIIRLEASDLHLDLPWQCRDTHTRSLELFSAGGHECGCGLTQLVLAKVKENQERFCRQESEAAQGPDVLWIDLGQDLADRRVCF